MIERRKYKTPEKFDKKSIWDRPFLERMGDLETEGKIAKPYSPGIRGYILHVLPGLTVTIQEDNFPLIAYGEPLAFDKAKPTLERLMGCELEEAH